MADLEKFFKERDKKRNSNKNKISLRSEPGIYKIVNKRTGEVFVSFSKNMRRSFDYHMFRLRNNRHHNQGLQEDFNNGDTFFPVELEVFMRYDEQEFDENIKKWIEKENSYNKGYNQTPGGNSGYWYYKMGFLGGRLEDD